MNKVSTTTWGYKIISESKVNFYHILLDKTNLSSLSKKIPSIQYIKPQKDGSIIISLTSDTPVTSTVDQIVEFFKSSEKNYLETPAFSYKITPATRKSLASWALSFQGCLALLVTRDKAVSALLDKNWQFINSQVGGLVLSPFTLFFYENHAKILHPSHIGNYNERKIIEQTVSSYIRKAVKRMQEAQRGLEGLALLSFVEEKTKLSQKEIAKIINEKSFGIMSPKHSPLFS